MTMILVFDEETSVMIWIGYDLMADLPFMGRVGVEGSRVGLGEGEGEGQGAAIVSSRVSAN